MHVTMTVVFVVVIVVKKMMIMKELPETNGVPLLLCRQAHDLPTPTVPAHSGSGATWETRRGEKKKTRRCRQVTMHDAQGGAS